MAFFLLSLIGIPPFVGFLGKLYVFAAVIEQGYWLVRGRRRRQRRRSPPTTTSRVIKVMVIDAGNEEKPPLALAFADRAWLAAFALANVAAAPVLEPDRGLGQGRARPLRRALGSRSRRTASLTGLADAPRSSPSACSRGSRTRSTTCWSAAWRASTATSRSRRCAASRWASPWPRSSSWCRPRRGARSPHVGPATC